MFGDARVPVNAEKILRVIRAESMHVVGVTQIHGAAVVTADGNTPRVAGDADAVVSTAKNTLLEVHVADCVPILLVDPETRVVAAVHAGWKGTLSRIVQHTVGEMGRMGAKPSRLIAVIGPHIGMCCYTVPADRVRSFQDVFGSSTEIASHWENSWHIDLGVCNRQQLIEAGIPPAQIDSAILCTSCQIDRFYSYRKDSKETFGEIIGVIGFT